MILTEIGDLVCKWRYIAKYRVCGMVRGQCYPENGWTPGEDSYREWIQVCDFYLAHQGRKFGLSTKVVEKNVPS